MRVRLILPQLLRTAALLLALALAPGVVLAQSTPVRQPDLRANPVFINAATLNGAVDIQVNNAEGIVGWNVVGLAAAGATLISEASNDGGATWSAVNLFSAACASSTTITADGQYRVSAAGHTDVRLRVSVQGVGQITTAYSASSVSSLGDCAPAASIGSVNQGNPGSSPWPVTASPAKNSGAYAPVTVGTSSAQVLAAGVATVFLDIMNESPTATIACAFGASAAINGAGSITIPPGWHRSWEGSFIPTDALNCISSSAGTAVTIGAK